MIRIQIMVYNKLVAEAICQNSEEADKLWARWCALRYKSGKELGCAATFRIELPRVWDIPVGSEL